MSCPLVVGPSNDAASWTAPLRCIAVRPDTSSDCSGRIHQAAFGAWSHAKEDILTTWTRFTDIRNLQAEIPKVPPARPSRQLQDLSKTPWRLALMLLQRYPQ